MEEFHTGAPEEMTTPEIRIAENAEMLARGAAELFIETAGSAIETNGVFTLSLSGGSTPKTLYSLLASEEFRSKVDWQKVLFFFGDERNVPQDDARSNFRMARETLFEPLRIDESNICVWITGLGTPEEVAEMYELAVKMAFDPTLDPAAREQTGGFPKFSPRVKNGLPRFDLFLLGLGPDGHTASLFPHTAALNENKRIAVANSVPQLNEFRLTMTFPVINNADHVVFLTSGSEKAQTVHGVIEGERRPDDLPAQRVDPADGRLIWMLDASAAALLGGKTT